MSERMAHKSNQEAISGNFRTAFSTQYPSSLSGLLIAVLTSDTVH